MEGLWIAVRGYAGFLPGLAIAVVAGVLLARRVGAALGVGRVHGGLVVGSVGLVLAATATPSYEALALGHIGRGVCDLARTGLAGASQLAWPSEVLLNILLFVPLGAVLGFCPASRQRTLAVAGATILPFAIELVQVAVAPLARTCQSGDVIDNLTGLTLGLAVGAGAALARRLRKTTLAPRQSLRAAAFAAVPSAMPALSAVGVMLVLGAAPAPIAPVVDVPRPSIEVEPSGAAESGETIRVTSIPDLLTALADDRITEIVVADGTYVVTPAAEQAPTSLWIGARFAGRTRPVTVRAETSGGVVFDGNGAGYFGGISFEEGAHHQTWEGFAFANGQATETGVITFGGYLDRPAPHHIALRDISILPSATGRATSVTGPNNDHAIYVSLAVDGPHDLLFEDVRIDGRGGLATGMVFYHSEPGNPNAWNVLVRGLEIVGTQNGLVIWDDTLRDITFDTVTITDVLGVAVNYESPGATGIVFANVTSTGSGAGTGFHSSLGPEPPGVTLLNNSFR